MATPAGVLNILVRANTTSANLGLARVNAQARMTAGRFGDIDKSSKKSSQALRNVGRAATVVAGGGLLLLAAAGKKAFSEFEESEKATRQTEAALKSTGNAAKVTASQIEELANQISLKSGIDDEAIQSGENLLLTFTKIRNETGKGNDIFNRATQTITDMSVALGQDLKSSAIQVGKALQDPQKGITALRRVGVNFTQTQQDMIEGWLEHGKQLKAQRFILRELTTEFGGSAAAQATSSMKLRVAWDNLMESFGKAFGPTLERAMGTVATFINQMQSGAGAGGRFADKMRAVGAVVASVVKFFVENKAAAVALIAAISAGTAAWAAYRITVAGAAVATTVATGGLNLIIPALAALAAAFAAAYASSEKFRDIVRGVARVFGNVVSFMLRRLADFFAVLAKLPVVGKYFGKVADAAKDMADRMDRVGERTNNRFKNMADNIAKNMRSGRISVKDGVSSMAESAKLYSDKTRAHIASNFSAAMDAIERTMSRGGRLTERGMKAIYQLTVQYLKLYGLSPKDALSNLDSIPRLKANPLKQRGGLVKRAMGGMVVPGSGSGDSVALQAMVEPGEQVFVLNRNASGMLNMLEQANAAVPRFQTGGLHSGIRNLVAAVQGKFPGLAVTSTTGGQHAPGSYHYRGMAADLASGSYPYMNEAAAWIRRRFTGSLTEGIHNPNLSVSGGRSVDPSFWGASTWAGHANHIHLAVAGALRAMARMARIGRIGVRGRGPIRGMIQRGLDMNVGAANRLLSSATMSAPDARFTGNLGHFGKGRLRNLWTTAGGDPGISNLMAAIALAESGGNPRAHNPSGASGLWQILGQIVPGNIYNPMVNARNAVAKYRSQGLGAWAVYSSGAYRQYLKRGGKVGRGARRGLQRGGTVGLRRGGRAPRLQSGGAIREAFMGAFSDQLAYRQALAALTGSTLDDLAVAQSAITGWQAFLDLALSRGDQAGATTAATNLKQWNDTLADLTSATEEQNTLLQQQIDATTAHTDAVNALKDQQATNEALIRGQGPALEKALLSFVSMGLGSPAAAGRQFPSSTGLGGLSRA